MPTSVARRLKPYKTGGTSYAKVREDPMDVMPPQEFLDWADRELRRPAVPYSTARDRLGLRLD